MRGWCCGIFGSRSGCSGHEDPARRAAVDTGGGASGCRPAAVAGAGRQDDCKRPEPQRCAVAERGNLHRLPLCVAREPRRHWTLRPILADRENLRLHPHAGRASHGVQRRRQERRSGLAEVMRIWIAQGKAIEYRWDLCCSGKTRIADPGWWTASVPCPERASTPGPQATSRAWSPGTIPAASARMSRKPATEGATTAVKGSAWRVN